MRNTYANWTEESLLALTYSIQQKVEIDRILTEIQPNSLSERMIYRTKQTFAVFGSIARELFPFSKVEDSGGAFEYVPVIFDGIMFEKQGRLLYLIRCVNYGGQTCNGDWLSVWLPAGCVRIDELEQERECIGKAAFMEPAVF